jgi:hypothetical protein
VARTTVKGRLILMLSQYAHPEVFTDITTGSNPGCGGDGFKVKEGWDPVTGLG